MEERIITAAEIRRFSDHLLREEKSGATYEKYLRDVRGFSHFAGEDPVTKELVVAWKKYLVEQDFEGLCFVNGGQSLLMV